MNEEDSNKKRIEDLKAIGEDEVVTPDVAQGLKTSALIMTMIKLPEVLMDIQRGMVLSKSDETSLKSLMQSLTVVSESFQNCAGEVDRRIPVMVAE